MKDRWGLIQRGLFPETLPPCFTSKSLKKSFSGLVGDLKDREFQSKRETDYVRYSGTKHDRSRRYFGTPNPISYFYVANFIAEKWSVFEERFRSSPFSVSQPRIGADHDDRPIIIPSLSELTTVASKKLGRSAFVLKTDISQFFPSIYTHSIPWSAHGIDASKLDTKQESSTNYFNRLDFHVRNCQRAETRGVLVGPDAFRVISEFIVAGIDSEIYSEIGDHIVGAARHVDDYYIGIGSETESLAVLSVVRDKLQRYNLQINDAKTKTMVGVEPLNEVWAQSLRKEARELTYSYRDRELDAVLLLNKSLSISKETGSDSPVKIALRAMDQIQIYNQSYWDIIEPYFQRLMFHHPHCIDYVALLVVKRVALGRGFDNEGWSSACHELIGRHLTLNHHHEIVWLLWLLLSTQLEVSEQLVHELSNNDNAHIRSLLVSAFVDGRLKRRPPISLGAKLQTTDDNWLLNLVAKSTGYSGASFSGNLSAEFQHLSDRGVKLIDFKSHLNDVKAANVQAISRTRYGYDSDDSGYEDDDDEGYGF